MGSYFGNYNAPNNYLCVRRSIAPELALEAKTHQIAHF